MRIVKWSPQQRVDVPDITAMSFLLLGEFRRHVRGVLLGPDTGGASQDSNNYIIRGFGVEAQAIPDTTAVIRLDPGSPAALSFAFMSENLGARNESGQLAGGNDSASRTEGNATTSVDFAALGAGAYFIEMRFVYADGSNDNRAFWNPATNTEFIAATDTRSLPAYEVRIVVGTSAGEWLTLASVAWDGVAVDPVDITDARSFAMEGAAPYVGADQSTAFSDFLRSTDRGALGLNEVYPVLRALGRQIQDLKGPNDVGSYDWFSRVYPPNDPTTLLPPTQTKTLRSVDTVTYTVGDGSTAFGDFNGASGLEDCLQHIEDMGGDVPRHVKVAIKSHSATPPTFLISTSHAFDGVLQHLELDCGGQSISCTHPAASIALNMGGVTRILEIVGAKSIALTNNATFAASGAIPGCIVRMRGIESLVGDASATAADLIRLYPGSILRDCAITGLLAVDASGILATTDFLEADRPIVIEHCEINGAMKINGSATGERRQPVKIINSKLIQSTTHALGLSAMIKVNSQADLTLSDCHLEFDADSDGLALSQSSAFQSTNIKITGCKFYARNASAVGGGAAIRLLATRAVSITDCYFYMGLDTKCGAIVLNTNANNTSIEGCSFYGGLITGRTLAASAIYLLGDSDRIRIAGCYFNGWETNTGVGSGRTIVANTNADLKQLTVDACTFVSCGGYCIQLGSTHSVDLGVLSNNSVFVPEFIGFGFDIEGWTRGAVTGNTMHFATAASPGLTGGATGDCVCSGNRFHNGGPSTGGAILWGFNGGGGPTNLNYIT